MAGTTLGGCCRDARRRLAPYALLAHDPPSEAGADLRAAVVSPASADARPAAGAGIAAGRTCLGAVRAPPFDARPGDVPLSVGDARGVGGGGLEPPRLAQAVALQPALFRCPECRRGGGAGGVASRPGGALDRRKPARRRQRLGAVSAVLAAGELGQVVGCRQRAGAGHGR
jgi:hypothetical protein